MAGNNGRRTRGGFLITGNDPLNVLSPSSTSQPTFLSTFNFESRSPILSNLCGYLPIAEIVSLTQTCRKLSGLYRYLLPIQWDVDEALRRYVDDPRGFRSQMAKYDALIDGTFVTQYFERVIWKWQPLIVSIQQGLGPELFSKYLSDIAGYDVKTEVNEESLITETRTCKRNSNSKVEIILHATSCSPAQSVLLEGDTTAEINILSWNKAYSVFPLPTFIQHKCYLLHDWDTFTDISARYISQRGWSVQGVMWPEEKRRNHPIRERRRVGDRYTWTIPFDTRKVESSKTPDYVLEHSCFKMDLSMSYDNEEPYIPKQEDVRKYTISAYSLDSKVLKHAYIYGDLRAMSFIFRRLHSSTVLELRKLNPAQRPTNYDQILGNLGDIDNALGDFDRPASWTYRDDDIPEWYKAFEKYESGRTELSVRSHKEMDERDGGIETDSDGLKNCSDLA